MIPLLLIVAWLLAACTPAPAHGPAESLVVHCPDPQRVNAVAHSHGGQVVAYAAWFGACFDTVITVATPVRADMEDVYARLRSRTKQWIHVHSDRADPVQWIGTLFDGRLGVVRTMAMAHQNVRVPGVAHNALMDADLWSARGWWGWLPAERPVVLIAGTWWTRHEQAWPRPTSWFSTTLRAHGLTLVNDTRGFGAWSGALNGVPGFAGRSRAEWSAGGEALFWYLRANRPPK